MKNILCLLFIVWILPQITYAEPVTLKCVTDDGQQLPDLIINIEKRKMNWGNPALLKYDIIHINETYITGLEKTFDQVGGEIWVINRATGEYKRASVGIFYNSPEEFQKGNGSLEANTYEGRCYRQQF